MDKEELKEIKEASQKCIALVLRFFEMDGAKTKLWFESENGMLGGLEPNFFLKTGMSKKLLKFIETQLLENEPPKSDTNPGAV